MAGVDPVRSLTCAVCSRSFGRYEHLQRHSRTHTKEKPYVCLCGRSSTRKDLLTRHERLNHSPSGRRRSTPATAGTNEPVTPSSGSQHDNLQSSAADSFPTDYVPVADHQSLGGFVLTGQDDPILDYTMLLNAPEMNLDGSSFIMDPMLNQQNLSFRSGAGISLPRVFERAGLGRLESKVKLRKVMSSREPGLSVSV